MLLENLAQGLAYNRSSEHDSDLVDEWFEKEWQGVGGLLNQGDLDHGGTSKIQKEDLVDLG